MRTGRPKKTEWAQCKVEGCSRTTKGGAKGFCRSHYALAHRGIYDWSSGKRLRPMKRVRSYGPGAHCLAPQCNRKPKALGLCTLHYQQLESGVDLGVAIPDRGYEKSAATYEGSTCKVPGCGQRPVNRWMCNKHTHQREAGIIDEDGNQLRPFIPAGRRPLDWRKELAGYILVRAPKEHPGARHDGSIYEHRLVMEKQLGRYLEPGEVVHHINGVRDDNRIENLQLRRSRMEHGHGHEMIEDVEKALSVLDQLVNAGMTGGEDIKARMRLIANRL